MQFLRIKLSRVNWRMSTLILTLSVGYFVQFIISNLSKLNILYEMFALNREKPVT